MGGIGSKPLIAKDRRGREYRYQTDGQELGTGSSGVVYLARRLPGGDEDAADDARRVAIKMTHVPKWKGYLAEEARLLSDLQAAESSLLAAGGGQVYRPIKLLSGKYPLTVDDPYESQLVELEYLDGTTLHEWFSGEWTAGPVPDCDAVMDEVLRTARQLAEALIQIQANPKGPVIHRDIKPDNVMRTSRGLRLFDFNVAREDDASEKTQHVGTARYMAPEVIDGGRYDVRSDLFGVGVILWEIATRRHFDRLLHTDTVDGQIVVKWPPKEVVDWPAPYSDSLGELIGQLVCTEGLRLREPRALLDRIERIDAPRRAERAKADPLDGLDMIRLLSELRPSGLVAVVTDTSGRVPEQELQDFLRGRMQVEDQLEDWIVGQLQSEGASNRKAPTLFVLAGNAGDGKSHLLHRVLRERLADEPGLLAQVVAIADATHSLSPDASQFDRLEAFFAPFADQTEVVDNRIHIIAMNTGMVIRFFDQPQNAQIFSGLYRELQRQLGLVRAAAEPASPPWRVEVVNLDLRDLLVPTSDGGSSFFERMLDRLDPADPDSIPAPKWESCKSCPAFGLCPVAFNLSSLQQSTPRQALLRVMRRVALDTDVHLSPRNLWAFLYRLTTGGIERYDQVAGGAMGCDAVRAQVNASKGEWLLAGQFTELLFQQSGAGTPWVGLSRHDPAFSSAPEIDQLHTRLSVKTELDNAPSIVQDELGGKGSALAGLALDALTAMLPREPSFKGRRRDAAVRRHVLFHQPTLEAWSRMDGGEDFQALLEAYDEFSRTGAGTSLSDESKARLKDLRNLVQKVFLQGNGRVVHGQSFLRVSQPNVRGESELLVRTDKQALDKLFHIQEIVPADIHIVAHRGREALLSLLGFRPSQVTLSILRVRLTVDLALYEFLRRVDEGQKPSVRDLSHFQALLFIGERVGNALARGQQNQELFVWESTEQSLFRLAADDFGQPHLEGIG